VRERASPAGRNAVRFGALLRLARGPKDTPKCRRKIEMSPGVHGGPRSSNQACSEPSICTSSPKQSRRRRG
jgi:hypothetical protein